MPVRNNKVPDIYQHLLWQHDPLLLFAGAVNAGLTFKPFEWQAAYAARLLAGQVTLTSLKEMKRWEAQRIEARGDGPKFALVTPNYEGYFEKLRALAGKSDGKDGWRLPRFQRGWFRAFMNGHDRRTDMWRRVDVAARKEEQRSSRPNI